MCFNPSVQGILSQGNHKGLGLGLQLWCVFWHGLGLRLGLGVSNYETIRI